ncbi:MAG: hypothetical protein ACRC5U_07820, partial [Plesiomonas sp.]
SVSLKFAENSFAQATPCTISKEAIINAFNVGFTRLQANLNRAEDSGAMLLIMVCPCITQISIKI